VDDNISGLIRHSTHTGRPLATDSVLSKLEHRLGRRLRPLPVGRPKKADKKRARKKKGGRKYVSVPSFPRMAGLSRATA
jgi:hypothetical protein